MKTFRSYSEVLASIGQEVAVSDWITITQAQIQMFADATGDQQWIHTDPERAAQGPFGAPIAHGFHAVPAAEVLRRHFQDRRRQDGVNYGLNRVRFMAPVPVNSRLRARMTLQAAERIEPEGIQMTWLVTVEREGSDKPVCVAESLARSFGAAA